MANDPRSQPDVIPAVTSDQLWMKNPECISCLARGLDLKHCPFYDVCPSCGSGPDAHGEHCPFKRQGPRTKFFRIHLPKPGKIAWWDYGDWIAKPLKPYVPDPKGLEPLQTLLRPSLAFPKGTTLPNDKDIVRAAWDNECREYGITNPLEPPRYIRNIRSVLETRKRRVTFIDCALIRSLDPEIAAFPAIRIKMIAAERQVTSATSKTVPPSLTAYGRLIQEQLKAQDVQHYSLDMLISKTPLPTGYFDLGHQFTTAFGDMDDFHTLPFGSLKAKGGIVLDNRSIDIGTRTTDSGWIPWLLRSVGFHGDNTLLFTYNHTNRGLYDSRTDVEDEDHITRRQKFTSLLINNSDLRVVLLCGPASRQEILASIRLGKPAVYGPYTLDFRGQKMHCWIQKHSDNSIFRMFVESPEPFPVVSSGWQHVMKLGEVFKTAVAMTDINVDAYYFEACSFRTKLVKQLWSERHDQDLQPWTPENIDPLIRAYLCRRGFSTMEDLEKLQQTNTEGSLSRALIVLLSCFNEEHTRKGRGVTNNNTSDTTSSKYQKIEKHEMEAVRKLYTQAETRRWTMQPTEKPLASLKDADEIVEERLEPESDEEEPIETRQGRATRH